MRVTSSHLICLLMRGTLQREMVGKYSLRPKSERAHEFFVRFVFYVSPSQTLTQYADLLFKRFAQSTPEERRLDISFTIENSKHTYAVCPVRMTSNISRRLNLHYIVEDIPSDDIVEDIPSDDTDEDADFVSTTSSPISYTKAFTDGDHSTLSLLTHTEVEKVIGIMGLRACKMASDDEDSEMPGPSDAPVKPMKRKNVYPNLQHVKMTGQEAACENDRSRGLESFSFWR